VSKERLEVAAAWGAFGFMGLCIVGGAVALLLMLARLVSGRCLL
jgi:hypothetical protein